MNRLEKPSHCAICGGRLDQPANGRPRTYCGPGCRRAAEYALRRAQQLALEAERAAMKARAEMATAGGARHASDVEKAAVKAWETEAKRQGDELRSLLAGVETNEQAECA